MWKLDEYSLHTCSRLSKTRARGWGCILGGLGGLIK